MRPTVPLVSALFALSALSGCFHDADPGSAAHEFLSGARYSKLIVEIDAQQGKELGSPSFQLLQQRIGERLDKPGGVTYERTAVAVSQETWTIRELEQAERTHRDHDRGLDTTAIYVLVVGGGFEKDSSDGRVLGVAYSPSSVAIFKDNIQATRPLGPIPIFSTSDVEKAVLIHELGHILGLVNLGLPMVTSHEMTEDPRPETPGNEGRGHSNNKDSVMYWAVESDFLNQVFNGPPPNQFDANDIADMRAAGGK